MKTLTCYQSQTSHPTNEELPYIFVTEFNDAATTQFYKQFLALSAKPEITVIPVVISSYGGEVHSLLSMLDIITSSSKPVATIALGKAMSCGAVLLAAGTKDYRFCAPNADVMIHEVSHGQWGKITETESGVKHVKKMNDKLFSALDQFAGQKTGYFKKQVKKMTNLDWYLTSVDCKRLGIVDHIAVPSLIKE